MVIYFTGTGNSRHLANRIAKQTGDTVTDAPALIKAGEYPHISSEKPLVFVAPTYAWRLPRVFEAWIRKCTFEGSKTAYFVLNCGSGIGGAGKYIEQLCADMGFTCMGTAKVVMPENYIAVFSAPSEKTAAKIIAKAAEKTDGLARMVAAGQPFPPARVSPIGRASSALVNYTFYKFTIGAKKFYTTDACISCGRCEANCMLNNVSLTDGRPVWGENCTHCMACICKCPTAAIEYGRHTRKLRRYTCPED